MTIAPPPRGDLDEDAGSIDFDALIGELFHPEGVRDRLELPRLSPSALDAAIARHVAAYARKPGRHNSYVPVPGEHSLRTDDLIDFLFCYAHENQAAVFRAADVRTGNLLRPAEVEAEAARQSIPTIWDWTGAADWLPASAIPTGTAAVFWSAHVSLVDGAEIAPGLWRPVDGPPPAEIDGRGPFAAEAVERQRDRAAAFAAAWRAGAPDADRRDGSLRHPTGPDAGLPIVVLVSPAADRVHGVLAASPAARAVLRWGDRVTLLPHEDATNADLAELGTAAATAHLAAIRTEEAA